MTAQSSFLIRCWLSEAPHTGNVKAYYIQHVQTGAEFRSTILAEVLQWMTDTNVRYLADTLQAMQPAADSSAPEELR